MVTHTKRADQRKFHYIYKITRTDGSGKYYIGLHSTDDLDDGYFGSGTYLWHSINKHGKEKHSMEIIEFHESRTAVKLRERELVNEELLKDPLCMNKKLGGEGGWDHITFEQRQKASNKMWLGISEQEKQLRMAKIADSNRKSGKISASMKIRNLTEEALIKARAKGTEKASSKESSAKRSETMKERGHMQGEKNSQFGTCWVTNGVKPIKIKKEELEQYLLAGWSKGRKNLTTD